MPGPQPIVDSAHGMDSSSGEAVEVTSRYTIETQLPVGSFRAASGEKTSLAQRCAKRCDIVPGRSPPRGWLPSLRSVACRSALGSDLSRVRAASGPSPAAAPASAPSSSALSPAASGSLAIARRELQLQPSFCAGGSGRGGGEGCHGRSGEACGTSGGGGRPPVLPTL